MRILLAFTVLVVAASSAFADADDAKRAKVFKALSRSADALKPFVRLPLSVDGFEFASEACNKRFPQVATVPAEDLPTLVACLRPLKIRRDGSGYIAEPGFPIDLVFEDGLVVEIEASGNLRPDRAAKNLAATATIPPDAEAEAAVASKKVPFLIVDIHLCVDLDGSVEDATVMRSGAEARTWAKAILAQVKVTRYKPFVVAGVKIRACTTQLHVYPPSKRKAAADELRRLYRETDAPSDREIL